MNTIIFEWDENKNRTNQQKHRISFEEAQTVFYDEEALVRDDPEHSEIRIISARKATKKES